MADAPADRIRPVPDGVARPLWSVMIPTYNCAGYLRESLAGVLAQDPGPDVMQIEVVDDCSTGDDPESVVRSLGAGRVGFVRQAENVGHSANFRTCLERSRGRLVHLLHGDDVIRDGFYRQIGAGFAAAPQVGAAFCRHAFMDENGACFMLSEPERSESGVLDGWLERIAVRQRIQTPSIAVRREIYETLGVFDSRLSWVEDWEMWTRIAARYPVWYEVQPLAAYRMHAASNSSRHIRSGENLRDVRRAVAIIQGHLPPGAAPRIRRQSLEFWAADALRNRAPSLLAHGDIQGSLAQMREALACSRSAEVLALTLGLLVKLAALAGRRTVAGARTNA